MAQAWPITPRPPEARRFLIGHLAVRLPGPEPVRKLNVKSAHTAESHQVRGGPAGADFRAPDRNLQTVLIVSDGLVPGLASGPAQASEL